MKEQEKVRQPWQQQVSEPRKAFSTFCLYRDMLPQERTIQKAALAAGKGMHGVYRQSAKWNWVERSEAWDQEQDRLKREAHLEEIVKMSVRHAQAAQAIMTTMMQPVQAMLQKMKLDPELTNKLATMEAGELLALINKTSLALPQVTNVERLSRGLPTEKREHSLEGMYVNVADADSLGATVQILIQAGVIRMGATGSPSTEVDSLHPAQPDPEAASLLTAGKP